MEHVDNHLKIKKLINDLQEVGKKIIRLEDEFKELELDMHDSMNYIFKLFAMRQFNQLQAMLLLANNENHILISRSMFEGAVYLGCFCKDRELAEDWRDYSLVIDSIRINNGEEAPDEVLDFIKNNQDKITKFKKKDGSFHYSWTKGESVKKLSEKAGLLDLYNKYYSAMSEFHHWGTKSFGIRYKCLENNISKQDSAEVILESLNAWCMSISSIINVLLMLSKVANLELYNRIEKIQEDLLNIKGIQLAEVNNKTL